MTKTYSTACPLDCWDQCSFLVTVKDGAAVSIGPDPRQQITGNVICAKGKQHLERLNHPDRLKYPLLKTGGRFNRISWDDALKIAADRISRAVARYGPLSLLHYYDGGHGGLLKGIESRFFSALGGCTTHRGSLCWSAGLAAQRYDFGDVLSHDFEDLINARCILIWGRNPADTSVHLLPYIRKAGKNGARVLLIDPVATATAALADQHIRINPATDGALALGMAHLIIKESLLDSNFVEQYCSGVEPFFELAAAYHPERVSAITGITPDQIETLARAYASAKPAAILFGYGLQRHSNGGNTIRAIDALAALTGNIGIPGGGASYANFRAARHVDHVFLGGEDLSPSHRYYAKPRLAVALREMRDPPIEVAYISRANPLTQVGASEALRLALAKIPFIISVEHFMTDTAAAADLVLPATVFLEEEDLYYNSMNHRYLNYGSRLVEPPGECRSEYDFLQELAKLLNLSGFPNLAAADLLKRLITPLTAATGLTLEEIKKGPLLLPGSNAVPWADRIFDTPDRKYNFYSAGAQADGCDPLPLYREPVELGDRSLHAQGYCYWFVTPHPRESIHSTHRLPDGETPLAYLHPTAARKHNLCDNDQVRIASVRGSITARAVLSDKVPPDAVLVYEGWWHGTGASVNNLTPDRLTDMGFQAALYDCLCKIEKCG
ncbi:MAG: molybdopterin-dependent oxidoreductase [Bacillota bacterium]